MARTQRLWNVFSRWRSGAVSIGEHRIFHTIPPKSTVFEVKNDPEGCDGGEIRCSREGRASLDAECAVHTPPQPGVRAGVWEMSPGNSRLYGRHLNCMAVGARGQCTSWQVPLWHEHSTRSAACADAHGLPSSRERWARVPHGHGQWCSGAQPALGGSGGSSAPLHTNAQNGAFEGSEQTRPTSGSISVQERPAEPLGATMLNMVIDERSPAHHNLVFELL
jgi:hypothetical protein